MQGRQRNGIRFVIDSMLGTLARKLRIFGFDSLYYNHIDDDVLLSICKDDDRILLTSDKELFKRAVKENIGCIFVYGIEEDCLVKIFETLDIKLEFDISNSRCPLCNSRLITPSKDRLKGIVPDKVYENNQRFYLCEMCEKIYWEGSHIRKMRSLIKRVNMRIAKH